MLATSLAEKFEQIWHHILLSPLITLVTHTSPDGDTIGAAVALKHIILANTKGKRVLISGHQPPRFLTFLDERDQVSDFEFTNSLVIVLDVSVRARFADPRVVTETSIKIDHHPTVNSWLLEIGGDHWPATGELIYELVVSQNLTLPPRAAMAIFVAIWTDTEGMSQRHPTARTRAIMAALPVDQASLIKLLQPSVVEREMIEALLTQTQVIKHVTCLMTEAVVPNDYARFLTAELVKRAATNIVFCATGAPEGNIRVSLRSQHDFNVEPVARAFGGGGHFNSSGVRVATMQQAQEILAALIASIAVA